MPYNVRLILDEIVREEQGASDEVGDFEDLEAQAAIQAVADMERRESQAAKAAKAAETRRLRDKKLADEIHRQVCHTHVAGSSKTASGRKPRKVRTWCFACGHFTDSHRSRQRARSRLTASGRSRS